MGFVWFGGTDSTSSRESPSGPRLTVVVIGDVDVERCIEVGLHDLF